ncbi:hypothetical protein H0I23_10610 [Cellulophaga sp. HaHaR_3_176]|uniref:hypothetical protein n=1 Tax=Cellulophaga sp. HaHaR_3_176 TaxID=1942464 RepID=UPI001C1F6D12|nr:hypothetical protein [Cellulophaga sp. HaHaR_3_176]QWX82911.1 hypothetical protein H0I23_10610 [Cellulophaga sp. HaHaR_3_176]
MSKYFICCYLFFTTCYISAQGGNLGQGSGVDDVRSLSSYTTGAWISNSNQATEIKGSPYLLDNWNTISVISTTEGKQYKLEGLNYNIVLDRMIARISKDSVYSFNPSGINEVRLGSHTFKRYLDPEYGDNNFFEIISNNKGKILLKRYRKQIKDGVFNPMTQKESPSKYLSEVDYFMTNSNNLLRKLPMNNRKLIKFLTNSKSSELQKFISENKFSAKKESDLVEIFDYFTSI